MENKDGKIMEALYASPRNICLLQKAKTALDTLWLETIILETLILTLREFPQNVLALVRPALET